MSRNISSNNSLLLHGVFYGRNLYYDDYIYTYLHYLFCRFVLIVLTIVFVYLVLLFDITNFVYSHTYTHIYI